MDPIDDADEAMSRYARGDSAAFGVVYRAVAPRLESYLGRHVRDRSRREDMIQQTFLQMHAARGTFTRGAAVMPWAYAIARRLMIDAGRRARREEPVELDEERLQAVVPGVAAVGGGPISGEQLVQADQTGACLAAAYAQLSEPQRAAFDLVKVEGLPYAQAAAVLGTTVTGIKLRVHRVHLALREALRIGARPGVERTASAAPPPPPPPARDQARTTARRNTAALWPAAER